MSSKTKVAQFLSLVQIEDYNKKYKKDIFGSQFFGFPLAPILDAEKRLAEKGSRTIAYFSMEYGMGPSIYHAFKKREGIGEVNKFDDYKIFSNMRAIDYFVRLKIEKILDLPIYSGGLGVLAGDTVKTTADLGINMVAIGILWHKGYFKQNFWFRDGQTSMDMFWDPYSYPGLIPLKNIVRIKLKNETISLKLWKYYAFSFDKKNVVPLILLDANINENSEENRKLTDRLYMSGDVIGKILQRTILGMGGVLALEELGYKIDIYHLNEGHAALAFIEKSRQFTPDEREKLKERFAYTCHTPVSAGHDRFALADLERVFAPEDFSLVKQFGVEAGAADTANFTLLAMNTAKFVNAVSVKHSQVTKYQFPAYADKIVPITNGVHVYTWVSEPMLRLFNKYRKTIGNWHKNPLYLNNIVELRKNKQFRVDLWHAHQENKKRLVHLFRHWHFNENTFTLTWARRIAAYKRPTLILQEPQRLLDLAKKHGPLQLIFAGKAHPHDTTGDGLINEILDRIDALHESQNLIKVVILENYDTYFGKLFTSSVDLWLNNPLPPFEASGTSGMKAILNAVPQLSTVDGWVAEAEDKNIGWFFGYKHHNGDIGSEHNLRLKEDSEDLYHQLEDIITLYYRTNKNGKLDPNSPWLDKMIDAIAAAGFFNTHRMVKDYLHSIWSKIPA